MLTDGHTAAAFLTGFPVALGVTHPVTGLMGLIRFGLTAFTFLGVNFFIDIPDVRIFVLIRRRDGDLSGCAAVVTFLLFLTFILTGSFLDDLIAAPFVTRFIHLSAFAAGCLMVSTVQLGPAAVIVAAVGHFTFLAAC